MKIDLNHDELVTLMKMCRAEIENPAHRKVINREQRYLLARVETKLQKEFASDHGIKGNMH